MKSFHPKPAETKTFKRTKAHKGRLDIKDKTGTVTLVGAGPGDPELLTIKAVRAIESADIILFDHLVSDAILDLVKSEAKRMLVGKRARQPSCKQDEINALMIKLAHQGKHVVRLKSGDPMVFGRAGEEISVLRQQGIPVFVVPGITAASAMAASLNVSLTHRDHAHSVRYVTGHSRCGELSDKLDWKGLADAQTTLIFYMGGKTAPKIALRLREEGFPLSTPIVMMAAISDVNEAVWQGVLRDLDGCNDVWKLTGLPVGDPVLIGIGDVFGRACSLEKAPVITNHSIVRTGSVLDDIKVAVQ